MATIEIKARENGPYKIPGVVTYVDADGQTQSSTGKAVALCRCGHSANKPFCDGSHRQIDFKAPLIYLQLNPEADQ